MTISRCCHIMSTTMKIALRSRRLLLLGLAVAALSPGLFTGLRPTQSATSDDPTVETAKGGGSGGVAASGLPDLIVQSMSITLETGGACDYSSTTLGVRVWIANVGTASAGAFSVEMDGSFTPFQAVDGLDAGTATSLWFPGPQSWAFYPITAIVDPTNVVVESDESNNQLTQNLAIPTLPPTCTPTHSPTSTDTPTPSATATSTPTATSTETVTPTSTVTATATVTNTPTPTPKPPCIGDVNDDGIVDVRDLVLVAGHMGSHVGDRRYDPRFDLNHDGRINVHDLMIVLRRRGTVCS